MKNFTAWAVVLLAISGGVIAWVLYKSTLKATASLESSTEQTSHINDLAGHIDNILKSFGV